MKYPKGLFVGLKLAARQLNAWVSETFKDFYPLYPVPPEHMHCTLVMTGKNIKEFEPLGEISVPVEKVRLRTLKGYTDRALIMTFDTTWFDAREQVVREQIDAKGKGGLNIPHVTLSYGFPPSVNLNEYKLPDLNNCRFVKEVATHYKRDWKSCIGVP